MKLKSCPFCGSEQIEIRETESGIAGLSGEFFVQCWGKECHSIGGAADSKTKAARIWNRRVKQ
jgi:Lar family restriction alleviation protein